MSILVSSVNTNDKTYKGVIFMKSSKVFSVAVSFIMCLCILSGCGSNVKKDVPLDNIVNNIKSAYGDDYLPNNEMTEEMFKSEFDLDMSQVLEYKAEIPLIGTHPDRLVIVKATSGKGADVEEKLNAVKDNKIKDTMQYPMNQAKINSAKVVRNGDYVAFIMLGAINDNVDATDQQAKQFADEQTQKGVNAFENSFK